MNQLRRAVWGYDVKEVNQYVRKFKSLSELDIDYLQQLIVNARKELTLLSHGSRPLDSIQTYTVAETSAAIAADTFYAELEKIELIKEIRIAEKIELTEEAEVVEDVELIEEAELVELVEEVLEEAALATTPTPFAGMGRLLMFRRKLDTSLTQNDQESESSSMKPFESCGFWESIDHYLQTPVISEELLSAQTIYANVSHQPRIKASSSAVGQPRYFDYSLSEPQIQSNVDSSQVKERRVKGIGPDASPTIKLTKSKDNTVAGTSKIPSKPERPSVTQSSKDITREVRQLRYKYIVGKWAGEDLIDSQNKLIVRKNSVITEEIVDTAEQEGKLSLLIIHMILPGLGEDM